MWSRSAGFVRWIRAGWAFALASALPITPTIAQELSLTIDDVLGMESFGDVSLSPDGHWLVYERRRAFDSAPRFDRGHRSVWAATDLFFLDLHRADEPMRLIHTTQEEGLVLGPWSPSGAWLLVYRVGAHRMEAGVLNVKTRTVRWTGLTPDMPLTGSGAEWRDDNRLLLTTRPVGAMPWMLERDGASQASTRRLWRDAAEGRVSSATRIDTFGGIAATTKEKPPQRLMEIDALSGEIRQVAEASILDMSAAPDGTTIALLVSGEGIPIGTGPVRAYEMKHRTRLRLLDAASGSVIAAPTQDIALHLLRWTSRSDAILVWGRADGAAWDQGGLLRVDRDGSMSGFMSDGLSPMAAGEAIDELRGVQADWLGEAPVLRARRNGRFDWFLLSPDAPAIALTSSVPGAVGDLAAVGEGQLLIFASGALWRVNEGGAERLTPQGGQVSNATSVSGMQALRLRLNAAPRRDWALARAGSEHMDVLGAEGVRRSFQIEPLSEGSMIAAASQDVIVRLLRHQGSEALWLSREREERLIDEANPEFATLAFPRVVAVAHLDRLGRPAQSWLTLPKGDARRSPRGLIVSIYPGSSDSGAYVDPRVLLYGVRPAFLAEQGYAVLSPAIPVESGEALAPDQLLKSVELAVDAALTAHPTLPSDRVAILGHSFGGTAALTLASSTRRFRSYIAWSAGTDFAGKWGEFDPIARIRPEEGLSLQAQMGWVETGQGQTKATPWEAPERFAALSPYSTAWRIQDPVLLISADRDFVPLSQSERIFTTLHRTGVRARMITYWGEGHFNWSPANIRDLYQQIMDWLNETLASPDGQSCFPRPNPRLDDDGCHDLADAPSPDQAVLGKQSLDRLPNDHAFAGESTVQKPGPYHVEAHGEASSIVGCHFSLGSALGDFGSQPIAKCLSGQGPVPAP
ncbi:prolyl oligopeptidase family serine peptidase [Brevundimonas naejangsanensis]